MFQGPAILDNPPVLTAPADITVNATSAAGATVDFTATATDVEDGALTPLCTPASGTTFAIGPTPVTCTATDSAQATATSTFNVTVLNTPPVLSAPANITVTATSTAGATVSFAAIASDIQDGPLTPVCTPASGTTFPVGRRR